MLSPRFPHREEASTASTASSGGSRSFRSNNEASTSTGTNGMRGRSNPNSYIDYDYTEDSEDSGDDDDIFDDESSSAFLANSLRIPSSKRFSNIGDSPSHQQQSPSSKLLDIIDDALNKRETPKVTWRLINEWLWKHSLEDISDAMAVCGRDNATPLHNICQLSNPPAEIIEKFVTASLESLTWTDNLGWLPLHHACAHNASGEVLKILVDANRLGTTKQDSHDRTPLHFYLIQCNDNNSTGMNDKTIVENVRNLSQMGAPKCADMLGMLPMHYAVAYSVSPSVLEVLRDAYPESIWAKDHSGRTPLHLAMANAYRDASPGVIKFLIDNSGGGVGGESTIGGSINNIITQEDNERLGNIRDMNRNLPLHSMKLQWDYFRGNQLEEYPNQRNNVCECLKIYLDAKPTASSDFLTALQDLPEWLLDVAVVTTHVRNIINQKIVGIFPTFMLFFEFVMYIVIILVFDRTSNAAIKALFLSCDEDSKGAIDGLWILWFGATYFLLREIIQIVSLWSLGFISRWFKDPYNWLDVSVIVLVYYFVMTVSPIRVKLQNCEADSELFDITPETFRAFAAFTKFLLIMAVVSFLRATLLDFAIVVGGVIYVTKRLGAFFLAVIVILITFAQIFYFLYYETDGCKCYREATTATKIIDNITVDSGNNLLNALAYITENCTNTSIRYENGTDIIDDIIDDAIEDMYAHCEFSRSILKVVTMMMGEIGNEGRYDNNLVAQLIYVAYAIIVVILLSNILIAIVTESYEVIQNDRAASVFLSNRLDFIAEMDAISYGVIRRLPKILGGGSYDGGMIVDDSIRRNGNNYGEDKGYCYHGWRKVMELFDDNFYDIQLSSSPTKVEFWCYLLYQILAIVVIIPVWLVLGLLTFGILWPPQIREMILVEKKATVVTKKDIEKQKLHQLKTIEKKVEKIQMDLVSEILIDRAEIRRVKNQVQTTQDAVKTDLEQIRELMQTLLVELGSSTRH